MLSRGFVSDSWAFLYLCAFTAPNEHLVGWLILRIMPSHKKIGGACLESWSGGTRNTCLYSDTEDV